MKSKTEFYQAFFETLEKNHKNRQIAFYGRQDAIIKNPFVEVEEKLMERLQALAKSTAIGCGICSDRPYDEAAVTQDKGGLVKINEHNGVVLVCKQHPIFDYVLSTYRKDMEHGGAPIQRQYFYNKEAAFEDFALRSGLVDEKKLFTETELKILHAGLVKLRTEDQELDKDGMESVAALVERIEDIVPELGKKERTFDFMKMFSPLENVRER